MVGAGGADPSKYRMMDGHMVLSAPPAAPPPQAPPSSGVGVLGKSPSAALGVQAQAQAQPRRAVLTHEEFNNRDNVSVTGQDGAVMGPLRDDGSRQIMSYARLVRGPQPEPQTTQDYLKRAIDENRTFMGRGVSSQDYHTAMGAQSNLLEALSRNESAARESDPNAAANSMRAIMADPAARAGYFASKGLPDPGGLGGGSVPVTAANFDIAASSPEHQALSQVLGNPDLDLHERLSMASKFPGVTDPASPTHQFAQEWINKTYGAAPAQWTEDTYIPPDPDKPAFMGPLGWPGVQRAAGLIEAVTQQFNPWAEHTSGTGLNWRENYRQRTRSRDLLELMQLQGPEAIPQ